MKDQVREKNKHIETLKHKIYQQEALVRVVVDSFKNLKERCLQGLDRKGRKPNVLTEFTVNINRLT